MIEKFQTLEVRGRKSSKPWKFFAVLFPMLGSLAYGQGPGSLSQGGFFQAWWGAATADPYERLLPTAYWYPSKDLNNTDRRLGIASTNTVNAASVTTNGWEFNGTSQYLDMGRPLEIQIGTNLQYSMAVWVYGTTSNNATRGIMGKLSESSGTRWGIYTIASLGHRSLFEQGSVVAAISPSTGYQSNIWYHIVVTVNRASANNFFFYRDGVREATGSYTNTNAITYDGNQNIPFRFGTFNDANGQPVQNFWNGYIDQAAVWNGRALTSNEVFNLFQETRSGRK
jgi:hypothetical protein